MKFHSIAKMKSDLIAAIVADIRAGKLTTTEMTTKHGVNRPTVYAVRRHYVSGEAATRNCILSGLAAGTSAVRNPFASEEELRAYEAELCSRDGKRVLARLPSQARQPKPAPKPRGDGRFKPREDSMRAQIAALMEARTEITVADIRAVMPNAKPSAIRRDLAKMGARGEVVRVGYGTYRRKGVGA